jgi:predicted ATPase
MLKTTPRLGAVVNAPAAPFIRALSVRGDPRDYSAEIPAVRALAAEPLQLHPHVTFLVGENGSGKSTLVEALAVAANLNPEGGSSRLRFKTRASHSTLHEQLRLEWAPLRPLNAFFLRAESVFGFATEVESGTPIAALENVYERPLHEQSHGESFLDIVLNRFGPRGLYILDEPEAALSVPGQLALMRRMHELVRAHAQFVVATHSPILIGYPEATIFRLAENGIAPVEYDEVEQVELTRSFVQDRGRFLRHLLADDD